MSLPTRLRTPSDHRRSHDDGHSGQKLSPYRAAGTLKIATLEIGEPVESRSREIDDSTLAHRNIESLHSRRQCHRRKGERIRSHHPHLVFIHLEEVEAPAPRAGFGRG